MRLYRCSYAEVGTDIWTMVGIGKLGEWDASAYCLLLPGKTLHISALLAAKRFRDKGNKDGAVRAVKTLQDAGLGQAVENKPLPGTTMVLLVLILGWGK